MVISRSHHTDTQPPPRLCLGEGGGLSGRIPEFIKGWKGGGVVRAIVKFAASASLVQEFRGIGNGGGGVRGVVRPPLLGGKFNTFPIGGIREEISAIRTFL